MLGTTPSYRAMMAVDIEKSAGRGDAAMAATHAVLKHTLQTALEASGISWADCHQTDLGDGYRIVAGRDLLMATLIDPLLSELASRLRAHNRSAPVREHIRIRMAVHAGQVYMREGRVDGEPLETLARLLDSPPLRSALAQSPQSRTVAVGLSEHFYDTIVRSDPSLDADLYQRVSFTLKEADMGVFVHVPGYFPQLAEAVVELPKRPTGSAEPRNPGRWAVTGDVVNLATDRARVGQQIGRVGTLIHHVGGDVHTTTAPELAGIRQQISALRLSLRQEQVVGRLDEDTYDAAIEELGAADDYLTTPDEGTKSRFILAMRRLKGLLEDVADLAAKVTVIVRTVRGL